MTSDKDFPFQFLSAARAAADARTPVIQRSDYYECTIEYVCRGRGFLEIEGRSFHADTNSVYFLHKGTTHRYWPDPEAPWAKLYVVVDGPLMMELFRIYHLLDVYYIPDAGELKPFFETMLRMNHTMPRIHERAAVLFHEFAEACAARLNRTEEQLPRSVRELKAALDGSIHRRFILTDYCRETGLSTAYMIRAFRSAFGQSPVEYLLTQKLEEAQRLLYYTQLSVKEIAVDLDFSGQYHFSHFFKQRTGLSPLEFRRTRQ